MKEKTLIVSVRISTDFFEALKATHKTDLDRQAAHPTDDPDHPRDLLQYLLAEVQQVFHREREIRFEARFDEPNGRKRGRVGAKEKKVLALRISADLDRDLRAAAIQMNGTRSDVLRVVWKEMIANRKQVWAWEDEQRAREEQRKQRAREQRQQKRRDAGKEAQAFLDLGLDIHTATMRDVKKARKEAARKNHPDLGGSDEAMKQANNAADLCEAYLARQKQP